MLELLPDGPLLTFGKDKQGRPTVELTVEPWAPADQPASDRRSVTVTAVVTEDTGPPSLPLDFAARLGLRTMNGRGVVRATIADRQWATEVVVRSEYDAARIGRTVLQSSGFLLP